MLSDVNWEQQQCKKAGKSYILNDGLTHELQDEVQRNWDLHGGKSIALLHNPFDKLPFPEVDRKQLKKQLCKFMEEGAAVYKEVSVVSIEASEDGLRGQSKLVTSAKSVPRMTILGIYEGSMYTNKVVAPQSIVRRFPSLMQPQ